MEILDHLIFDFVSLLSLLQGSAPIHRHLIESRDWGKSEIYIVKEGYRLISNNKEKYRKDTKWTKTWYKHGLPKINAFFWILVCLKTLTVENLRKKGVLKGHHVAFSSKSQNKLSNIYLLIVSSLKRFDLTLFKNCMLI